MCSSRATMRTQRMDQFGFKCVMSMHLSPSVANSKHGAKSIQNELLCRTQNCSKIVEISTWRSPDWCAEVFSKGLRLKRLSVNLRTWFWLQGFGGVSTLDCTALGAKRLSVNPHQRAIEILLSRAEGVANRPNRHKWSEPRNKYCAGK